MKFSRQLLAAGIAAGLLAAAAPAFAEDQIRILCPTWSGYAPIFVAADLGYFKAMNLNVNIKFDDERADVMAAMARGDIEMDLRTVGEYQGRPRDASTPGVIIGTIDESLGGDGVIADGSIKSVADLKGKVVASELNIPGRLLLQLDLKKYGMTLKDLKLKEIASADTVSVFADPSVAAVVSYEPYLSQA
jgi:NitT/TauT family transport system substrate-binding protein